MRVEVLGCSGGIGGAGFLTTSLLVDEDILIDCGTGVGQLSLEALLRIEHIFLTHAHLDHIAMLPMLIDTIGDLRSRPIIVHAGRETLKVLREHVFNWLVWPDFTVIPGYVNPMLRLEEIRCGQTLDLAGRMITPIPARHAVPATGYLIDSGNGSLAFSGDTAICEEQIAALNAIPDLRYLIIEAAFPESQRAMAEVSCHLSSGMLHEVLRRLTVRPEVFVTHLKPGYAEEIAREVLDYAGDAELRLLVAGQRFELGRQA